MNTFKSVPITLITGYLGSGKTTLINHILRNAKDHKMAVIVNDIGEVNIDAELIEGNGVVSGKDENLVALSNGCICCTLKKDLITQLADLVKQGKFDHILIEASGICEPVPIAQTITYMENEFEKQGLPRFYYLDAIISVTDALRLKDEFSYGEYLPQTERGEENLENLIIQQIEFCDIVLLNKVSLLDKEEVRRVKLAIKALQPDAKIIDADYCKVDIDELIDTDLFDFEKASGSAAWIREFEDWDTDVEHHDDDDEEEEHHHHHDEDDDDDDDEHEEHEHHHHHHHNHHGVENEEEGTALEYDINTFVYYRRKPFDMAKFENWINKESDKHHIIRAKGVCYFSNEIEKIYVYESAGKQVTLTYSRQWFSATLTKKQLQYLRENDENFAHDWDDTYQDRLIKLVFIGQNLNEKAIRKELDQI
ncbi:MAG: GTP-binding protein [Bacilli bacterium]|nr:GTP-binding protein [Bacilli bacterium]